MILSKQSLLIAILSKPSEGGSPSQFVIMIILSKPHCDFVKAISICESPHIVTMLVLSKPSEGGLGLLLIVTKPSFLIVHRDFIKAIRSERHLIVTVIILSTSNRPESTTSCPASMITNDLIIIIINITNDLMIITVISTTRFECVRLSSTRATTRTVSTTTSRSSDFVKSSSFRSFLLI